MVASIVPVFPKQAKNYSVVSRGVVVPERGGAPFRQIFFERERRFGKYCLSQPER